MESVFEAENTVEAHMVVHLLARSGIGATVLGEHLQGGVGELPAHGNVRVAVEPEDVAKAREVIEEWNTQNANAPEAAPSTPNHRGHMFTALVGFVAGAGLATAFLLWAFNSPVSSNTSDYNRDGRTDEWAYWRGDFVTRVDVDRNFDGDVDAVTRYSPRDWATNAEYDNDFDGVFEHTSELHYGQPARDEIDVDGDGLPDRRHKFRDGVLATVELLRPDALAIMKTQTYSPTGALIEARFDSDGDGKLDTLMRYDRYEEEISRESMTP